MLLHQVQVGGTIDSDVTTGLRGIAPDPMGVAGRLTWNIEPPGRSRLSLKMMRAPCAHNVSLDSKASSVLSSSLTLQTYRTITVFCFCVLIPAMSRGQFRSVPISEQVYNSRFTSHVQSPFSTTPYRVFSSVPYQAGSRRTTGGHSVAQISGAAGRIVSRNQFQSAADGYGVATYTSNCCGVPNLSEVIHHGVTISNAVPITAHSSIQQSLSNLPVEPTTPVPPAVTIPDPPVIAEKTTEETKPKQASAKPQPEKNQPEKKDNPKAASTKESASKKKGETQKQNSEPEKRKAQVKPNRSGRKPKKPIQRLPLKPVLAWNMPNRNGISASEVAESDEIVSHESIRISEGLGLDLTHGWVQFPDSSKNILQGIQKSGEFSIIASVTCDNDKQRGPARILSCSKDTEERNFTLGQDGKKFVIRIRSSREDVNGTRYETSFGRVRPGKRQQLAVSYDGHHLICVVDGRIEADRKFETDFSSWKRFPVIGGNEYTADREWSGLIHSLVVIPSADPQPVAQSLMRLSQ